MENWKKDSRKDIVMVDVDALVPPDHLLRKVERVMDYDWLYERLSPYYCADNGRPGTDPVVLIKMVLIQHLFGIASLRQTHREIQVNIAYRWFLGYSLLDEIPHFATVSYAFCKRFPPELSEEIFAHILNKALNNRMVDESTVCVGGRPRLTNFPATEETVRLSNSLSLGLTWSMVVVFEATSQLHPEECRRGGNYALSQDTWLSE